MNEFFIVGIIVGIVIGTVATTGVCVRNTTSNTALRGAGIERIAYCCNAHSNWYEIVWKTEKTKEADNGK